MNKHFPNGFTQADVAGQGLDYLFALETYDFTELEKKHGKALEITRVTGWKRGSRGFNIEIKTTGGTQIIEAVFRAPDRLRPVEVIA